MKAFSNFIEGFFFPSDRRDYWKPEHYGLKSQRIKIEHPFGYTLDALLLQVNAKEIKGRILALHSGLFNREFNLPQVIFLVKAGYEVLIFDYSGYGESGGHSCIDSLLIDTEAAVDALDKVQNKQSKFLIFAQGVGCDAALQYYHRHPERISGLILESGYDTRKGWIKDRWGPFIGDIAAYAIKFLSPEPAEILPNVHVPLLVVYPSSGRYIHKKQRTLVCNKLPRHAKLWLIEKMPSFGIFTVPDSIWQKNVLHFIEKKVLKQKR